MIGEGQEKRLSTTYALNDMGPKMKVELDKRALFALASDSRMEILKALHLQRRTLAQLAEHLGIDKAAVHRHLKKLEEGGLVVRYEDHGFVYYGLSWKARDVISPGENTKIVIIFGLSLLLVCFAAFSILIGSEGFGLQAGADYLTPETQAGGVDSPQTPSQITMAYVLAGAFSMALSIVMIYAGFRKILRPKQKFISTGETSRPPTEPLFD
ncbi:MAG: winged helix-turn-helix domain-containing protein [Methanomassiliicoccales archaeon]